MRSYIAIQEFIRGTSLIIPKSIATLTLLALLCRPGYGRRLIPRRQYRRVPSRFRSRKIAGAAARGRFPRDPRDHGDQHEQGSRRAGRSRVSHFSDHRHERRELKRPATRIGLAAGSFHFPINRANCRAGHTRQIELSGGARPINYFPFEGEMESHPLRELRLHHFPAAQPAPIHHEGAIANRVQRPLLFS